MKTSYYSRLNKIDQTKFVPIAISGDEGRMVGFNGKALRKLSPYPFFRRWKAKEDEIEIKFKDKLISDEEYRSLKQNNEDFYIETFYNKILKPLQAQEIFDELGENAVLLCFEKPTDFCHRFLVAGWLEYYLGIQIDEYGFENDKNVLSNKIRIKEKLINLIENEINPQLQ